MTQDSFASGARRGLWIVGGIIIAFILLALAASAWWSARDDNAVEPAFEAEMPPGAPTPMGEPETLPPTTNPAGPTGGEPGELPVGAEPPPISQPEAADGQ